MDATDSLTRIETWRRVEGEAFAQVRADLVADESASLAVGHVVAWSVCRFGRTDGFSPVHRVGTPILGTAVTFCGEIIPPSVRLVPLTPNLVRTLGRCPHCERLNVQEEPALAADAATPNA